MLCRHLARVSRRCDAACNSEDVLKVQMLVALATEVAATGTKPADAGSQALKWR
jgi:hypothetical protein